MLRSLPIALLALASLLFPAVAAAAPASAAPASIARSFEIHALVIGGTRIEVMGKLWIDGGKLGASVGCNSIGAEVTVDGNVVTITGSTSMTEMACPGVNGDAEAAFLRILDLGRFTIEPDAWTAEGGKIITVEVSAPDPGPGNPAEPVDPNQPVCAVTGPNIVVPDGAPGGAGGSGSSGSGSSGSGSGSGGVPIEGSGGGSTDPSSGGAIDLPLGSTAPPAPPIEPTGTGEAKAVESTDAPTREAPPPPDCVVIGKVDPGNVGGGVAPGTAGELSTPTFAQDTARDVLFVPLAIGLGLIAVITVIAFVALRPQPKVRDTDAS